MREGLDLEAAVGAFGGVGWVGEELVRWRRGGPAADDGAEEAGVQEGEGEAEVQVGVWDRGQAQARFGCVL